MVNNVHNITTEAASRLVGLGPVKSEPPQAPTVRKVHRYPVIEIFGPTIQGEGIMTGSTSHFLRFAGCGYRCKWCDSMYAVDPAQIKENVKHYELAELLGAINVLGDCAYITLTGGDPCIQTHMEDLTLSLSSQGYRLAVETQGQYFPPWLINCDVITFSPKPPSSGNITEVDKIAQWLYNTTRKQQSHLTTCVKIAIFTPEDFEYAVQAYTALTPQNGAPLYDEFWFIAGTPQVADVENRLNGLLTNYHMIAEQVLQMIKTGVPTVSPGALTFNPYVRVGCQQHVLLWPTQTRGV